MSKDTLQMRILDAKIKTIHTFILPKNGWIKPIRNVLGITKSQLAKKMNVTAQRLGVIEKGEREQTIKIRTLEKVAKALNCNLFYCFIPNQKSFERLLEDKVDSYVKKRLKLVQRTMELEGQGVNKETLKIQGELLKKELYTKSLKEIWNE